MDGRVIVLPLAILRIKCRSSGLVTRSFTLWTISLALFYLLRQSSLYFSLILNLLARKKCSWPSDPCLDFPISEIIDLQHRLGSCIAGDGAEENFMSGKHSANLAASPALLVLSVHVFAELGTESRSLAHAEPVLYHWALASTLNSWSSSFGAGMNGRHSIVCSFPRHLTGQGRDHCEPVDDGWHSARMRFPEVWLLLIWGYHSSPLHLGTS